MEEAFALGVTMQIYFSRYHLHAARAFRDQVGELEKGGFSMAHRSNCRASVIASASFLEAVVNEAFHGAASGFGIYCRNLPGSTSKRIADVWELADKPGVSTLERFRHFVRCCDGAAPDKGAEPWQSAQVLFELRNALVHAQPIDTGRDPSKPVKGLATSLCTLISPTRGYALNHQFSEGGANPFFPDCVLGHGCCCWAVDSAEAFAGWFAQATGLRVWWEPARDSK